MLQAIQYNLKLKRAVLLATIAVTALLFASLQTGSVSAQEEAEVETTTIEVQDSEATAEEATTTEEVEQPTSYRFVAEKCDSLTKLVRRAILVYDEVNDDIEMTKEGIVYAETNIVQDMGAYWLEIGQVVEVPVSKIEQYTASSQDLTDSQVAAWATYVPFVDFEISNIQQPENREEVDRVIEESLEDTAPEVSTPDEADDNTSAWWWVAGVGTVAIVWYLLWKREEN